MNIKLTMSKLQEIIKEELKMIDVSEDIIEDRDDDKAFEAFKSVIKTLRSDVFPKLNEEELYAFGQQMYRFFESYKS